MGGLGKTTLAAALCRAKEVRQAFSRIGFVSAGASPEILELQRELHEQLLGTRLEDSPSATVHSQKELLQAASANKQWLVVLDDIWATETEKLLNFVSTLAPLAIAMATGAVRRPLAMH